MISKDKYLKVIEDLDEACELLNTVRTDAYMALDGTWDKSIEGFESQIDTIERFFSEVNFKYDEYVSDKDQFEEDFFNSLNNKM